ncbi:MAG TPA: hypothetical protein DCK87_09220, partial [Desulfotomaculum sp.]|nr:hypothetical protein [Desulfotomaculum sp.]
LAKKLEKEAGALFMDQKEDGSWYENPLVPYPPEEQASSHIVQSGETLSKIAQTYGLTLDELLALNPDIKDPSKITVGQELTILIPGFIAYHGPVLTEDDRVVILSADQTQELAQAKYDEQTKEWEWEKLAATAPAATVEATLEDASSLLLELDSGIISSLTKISKEIYDKKYLKSYKNRADELITGMGITDPYLVELYREFFNTEWVQPSWPGTEYHGLGIYTLTEQGKKPYLHSAVGLLYGFVPIENIPQQVIEAEKNASNILPRPYYLILQIGPGKDLTPENNPDAFVALKMGAHIYGGEYDASGFALKKAEDSKLEGFVVERITSQEPRKTSRGPDAWTLEELSSAFGLRKNSLIFVTGMAQTPGEASVSWFSIIVPEFPSEEVQKQYHFFLD